MVPDQTLPAHARAVMCMQPKVFSFLQCQCKNLQNWCLPLTSQSKQNPEYQSYELIWPLKSVCWHLYVSKKTSMGCMHISARACAGNVWSGTIVFWFQFSVPEVGNSNISLFWIPASGTLMNWNCNLTDSRGRTLQSFTHQLFLIQSFIKSPDDAMNGLLRSC